MGRLLGSLKDFSGSDLGGIAIKAALERAVISGDQVEYVIMGQVLQAGTGQMPARHHEDLLATGRCHREIDRLSAEEVCTR